MEGKLYGLPKFYSLRYIYIFLREQNEKMSDLMIQMGNIRTYIRQIKTYRKSRNLYNLEVRSVCF